MEIEFKSIHLSNGETMAYRLRRGAGTATGRTLLLVHGNMTSSVHWDLFMESFDPSHTLIAVDLRGFGASTYHVPVRSIADFSADLRLFVDGLNLTSFTLMGWSMGGGVAMQFAASHPQYVETLILLASMSTRGYPCCAEEKDPQSGRVRARRLRTRAEIAEMDKTKLVQRAYNHRDKAFLRNLWNRQVYVIQEPDEVRYETYLNDMLTQKNLLDVYDAMNRFNMSVKDHEAGSGSGDAARLLMPTLVLWGSRDNVVTRQMTEELIEDLGERIVYRELDHTGHSPIVDNLALLCQVVAEFMERGRQV
ncbi:alpha/beta fold hydrolase [Paenibacillus ehimensis]|uniref:intracellular short-chain-length polyhydroxyalkanoate depolymerase n=1 Tax=Paenibacillus ehimensis TaxID=79264 RepID=UPI00046E80AC|nr:alpha/beta hydrolase [Paenibacillus ehimensis]